jgi:SRSO17 transposase
LYPRGLLLDGKRKSMQPMAGRLGVNHQQLQQFVTSSTCDYGEVRRRVARWADEFVVPQAYVIDDTGFPKDGADSPGVARMYSGDVRQDRQLPDRGQRARGHRLGIRGDRLAAVPAGLLGRCRC